MGDLILINRRAHRLAQLEATVAHWLRRSEDARANLAIALEARDSYRRGGPDVA